MVKAFLSSIEYRHRLGREVRDWSASVPLAHLCRVDVVDFEDASETLALQSKN
jgi:hypothetical protein